MVFLVFNQNNRFRAVDINHAVCAELQKIYQMSSLFRVIAPNVKISECLKICRLRSKNRVVCVIS